MKNREYIDRFLNETKVTLDRIQDTEAGNLDKVIEILFAAWKDKKHVFIFGNGGSASNAQHFACDLAKCTIVESKQRMRVKCFNDNAALFTAHVNDDGWENVYVEQLINEMEQGDVVIAISVHGGSGRDKAGAWSQNLLKAVDYANQHGAHSIGLSGFDGGALKELAEVCITMPVNSTPHVEPLHTLMHHMICDALREKITNSHTSIITPKTYEVPARRAVFLDRDGVINKINYDDDLGLCTPHTPEDFRFLPNVPESIKKINDMKFAAVVVSNQPDISKGRLSIKNHEKINEKMVTGLKGSGARLDGVYYCFHKSEDDCECRKPKPGMLERAAETIGINLIKSYVIGDSLADIEAGEALKCRTILLANPRLDILNIMAERGVKPDYIVKDLGEAVELIEKLETAIEETYD